MTSFFFYITLTQNQHFEVNVTFDVNVTESRLSLLIRMQIVQNNMLLRNKSRRSRFTVDCNFLFNSNLSKCYKNGS